LIILCMEIKGINLINVDRGINFLIAEYIDFIFV
jgi:hypothetical protein